MESSSLLPPYDVRLRRQVSKRRAASAPAPTTLSFL
jgi:hypothetical protein